MPMDNRFGYGLTLDEALEKAKEVIQNIKGEKPFHFSMSTDRHSVVWGEARTDGWRVYKSAHIPSNNGKETS